MATRRRSRGSWTRRHEALCHVRADTHQIRVWLLNLPTTLLAEGGPQVAAHLSHSPVWVWSCHFFDSRCLRIAPPCFSPTLGPARHGLPRRHATACCASPVALLISGQIRARFRGAAAAIPGHATAHVVGARRRRSPAGPPVQQGCCVHGPCGFALSRTENVNVGFVCLRGGVPRRPTQKPPPLHTRLGPVYAPGVCLEHSGPCWAGRRTRRATVTGWCHPAPLCPPPGCCALCCITPRYSWRRPDRSADGCVVFLATHARSVSGRGSQPDASRTAERARDVATTRGPPQRRRCRVGGLRLAPPGGGTAAVLRRHSLPRWGGAGAGVRFCLRPVHRSAACGRVLFPDRRTPSRELRLASRMTVACHCRHCLAYPHP